MEGNVDPVRDIEIIHEELRLKDVEMIAPVLDKLEKTAVRGNDKKLKPEYVSSVSAILLLSCLYLCHYASLGDIADNIIFSLQDIMLKVKNWVEEEKNHIRFYPEWNEKEVRICVFVLFHNSLFVLFFCCVAICSSNSIFLHICRSRACYTNILGIMLFFRIRSQ